MKSRHALSMLLVAALGAQLACSRDTVVSSTLFAPEGTEPLPLTVRVRPPVFRERLPAIEVSGLAGSIRVEVARPDIGCTLAQATVGREPGVLTVVARVGGDPLALCSGGNVVEYAGVIGGVAPGRYTVHIFEAVGDGAPRRLGTRTVTALPPAA